MPKKTGRFAAALPLHKELAVRSFVVTSPWPDPLVRVAGMFCCFAVEIDGGILEGITVAGA